MRTNDLELTRTRGYEGANHANQLLAKAHASPICKHVARVGCSELLGALLFHTSFYPSFYRRLKSLFCESAKHTNNCFAFTQQFFFTTAAF